MLSKGLISSVKSLYILSRPPVNKFTIRKALIVGFKEIGNNVTFHYLKIIEIPILKHISIFVNEFIKTMKWCFKNRKQENVIICDVLNISISVSALLASKICNVKSVAIVTDVPSYMQNYSTQKKSIIKRLVSNLNTKICSYFMCRYDLYIILTEQMNELVNPNRKEYIVIEGMVDFKMNNVRNSPQDKYTKKIIVCWRS